MARSIDSSVCWLFVHPTTASQSEPDSRSRIDVSSRNVRSSVGLALQHLLGQVVQHEPVASGELLDEAGDVVTSLQRQGRQLKSGRPALGAFAESRDDRGREIVSDRHAQQLGRLSRG